jgi:CheY-like chemotaxis protein
VDAADRPSKCVVILVAGERELRDQLRVALLAAAIPRREVVGYPVGLAAAALLYLRSVMPDLLVLDVELPDMDGLELCRRLLGDPVLRRVPVVALRAKGPTEEARAASAGAARVLAKPIAPAAFIGEVRDLLAKGRRG